MCTTGTRRGMQARRHGRGPYWQRHNFHFVGLQRLPCQQGAQVNVRNEAAAPPRQQARGRPPGAAAAAHASHKAAAQAQRQRFAGRRGERRGAGRLRQLRSQLLRQARHHSQCFISEAPLHVALLSAFKARAHASWSCRHAQASICGASHACHAIQVMRQRQVL